MITLLSTSKCNSGAGGAEEQSFLVCALDLERRCTCGRVTGVKEMVMEEEGDEYMDEGIGASGGGFRAGEGEEGRHAGYAERCVRQRERE